MQIQFFERYNKKKKSIVRLYLLLLQNFKEI